MTVKRKLKGRGGFSLAEMLLATLILLLVATIVATGVPAARNAYYKVILGSNAQSLLSTTAAALRDKLTTAWDVKVAGNKISYYNSDTGIRAEIDVSAFTVTELKNTSFVFNTTTDTGSSYKLLPAAAATDDMTIAIGSVGLSDAKDVVTFSNLVVKSKDGTELARLDSLAIRVISANTQTISGVVEGYAGG